MFASSRGVSRPPQRCPGSIPPLFVQSSYFDGEVFATQASAFTREQASLPRQPQYPFAWEAAVSPAELFATEVRPLGPLTFSPPEE
jgi:hypothetical protein